MSLEMNQQIDHPFITVLRKNPLVQWSLLCFIVIPLIFCSCKSTSPVTKPPLHDPYAQNAPKSKEEEAYYQDVYSGDWKEQPDPFGFGKSVGKKSGSVSMPPHWEMIPEGAKTTREIRAELAAKKQWEESQQAAQYRYGVNLAPSGANSGMSYPPYVPQMAYTGPISEVPIYSAVPVAQPFSGQYIPGQPPVAGQPMPSQSMPMQSVSGQTIPMPVPGNPYPPATYPNLAPLPPVTPYQGTPYQGTPYPGAGTSPPLSMIEPSRIESSRTESSVIESRGSLIIRGQMPEPVSSAISSGVAQSHSVKVDPEMIKTWQHLRRPLAPTYFGYPLSNDKRFLSNEFIADGGDAFGQAYSPPDWSVHHLEQEDTIAHFDTKEGRILVEPSNRVHIYSPRFGSVRQVSGPRQNEQLVRLQKTELNLSALQNRNLSGIDIRSQENKADYTRAQAALARISANETGHIAAGEVNVIENYQETILGSMIVKLHSHTLTDLDLAVLMSGSNAAQSWSERQEVAVSIDNISAQTNVFRKGAEVLYQIENGTKTSQLRLIKIASKDAAIPGELIEFTLRFENVGNQIIGNVTILDNLSARLAYIDGSTKMAISRKKQGSDDSELPLDSEFLAQFIAKTNEQGSLILRWEITDPLEPGDFGVIQFICKIR